MTLFPYDWIRGSEESEMEIVHGSDDLPWTHESAVVEEGNESKIDDDVPTKEKEHKTQGSAEEEYVNAEDVDDDRDVVVDKISSTPKRTIYRRFIEGSARGYRFVKRGDKMRFVERLRVKMIQAGVRFLSMDFSLNHFGKRLRVETNKAKMRDRIVRCLRESNRNRDIQKDVAVVLGNEVKTILSKQTLISNRDSGSSLSHGSRVYPLPPVQQVNVPSPSTRLSATSTINGLADDMSSIQGVSVISYKDYPAAGSNPTSQNTNTTQVTAETEHTANDPTSHQQIQTNSSLRPSLDTGSRGKTRQVDHSASSAAAAAAAEMPLDMAPPNLMSGIESWASLAQYGDDLQQMVERDILGVAADDDDDDEEEKEEEEAEAEANSTMKMDTWPHEQAKDEAAGFAALPNEPQATHTIKDSTSTISTYTPKSCTSALTAQQQQYFHLARHLLVLEEQLNRVMEENGKLKHRMTTIEKQLSATPLNGSTTMR